MIVTILAVMAAIVILLLARELLDYAVDMFLGAEDVNRPCIRHTNGWPHRTYR